MYFFRLTLFASLCGLVASPSFGQVPDNLVLDVRLFEARSTEPDFQAMESLRFFISTDGEGISHEQWLGTLAIQMPDSFLAALSSRTVPVEDGKARWTLQNRSRRFEAEFDFSKYIDDGVFASAMKGELKRGDSVLETVSDDIELALGQTFVFSNRDLEVSISNYVSHFRDYEDRDHRAELFDWLRAYNIFLVIAVTPRLVEEAGLAEPMVVELPSDAQLPEIESPQGVVLQGAVTIEFEVDGDGAPLNPQIVRSSVPELNPRLLLAVADWRFPAATGRRAQLMLDVATRR